MALPHPEDPSSCPVHTHKLSASPRDNRGIVPEVANGYLIVDLHLGPSVELPTPHHLGSLVIFSLDGLPHLSRLRPHQLLHTQVSGCKQYRSEQSVYCGCIYLLVRVGRCQLLDLVEAGRHSSSLNDSALPEVCHPTLLCSQLHAYCSRCSLSLLHSGV